MTIPAPPQCISHWITLQTTQTRQHMARRSVCPTHACVLISSRALQDADNLLAQALAELRSVSTGASSSSGALSPTVGDRQQLQLPQQLQQQQGLDEGPEQTGVLTRYMTAIGPLSSRSIATISLQPGPEGTVGSLCVVVQAPRSVQLDVYVGCKASNLKSKSMGSKVCGQRDTNRQTVVVLEAMSSRPSHCEQGTSWTAMLQLTCSLAVAVILHQPQSKLDSNAPADMLPGRCCHIASATKQSSYSSTAHTLYVSWLSLPLHQTHPWLLGLRRKGNCLWLTGSRMSVCWWLHWHRSCWIVGKSSCAWQHQSALMLC